MLAVFMNVLNVGRHNRTRNHLANFIVDGSELFDERFDSADRFAHWRARYESWHADVQRWMSENLSASDSIRFRNVVREGPVISYWPTAGGVHNRHVNQLRAKLMFLGSI